VDKVIFDSQELYEQIEIQNKSELGDHMEKKSLIKRGDPAESRLIEAAKRSIALPSTNVSLNFEFLEGWEVAKR
jgi:hypothetical protein